MSASASPAGPEPWETRSARRYPASAVPSITGLRISPHGIEAVLLNISESGVLAECGDRLKPESPVTVIFEGAFQPASAEGRVVRNSVASLSAGGLLRYHVGIAFATSIPLDAILGRRGPALQKNRGPESTPAVRNRW